MDKQLSEYYKLKGISAIDFNCPHYHSCSATSPQTFTTAKEAFVSSGYVKHELPRIVFLSLDSGSAEKDPHLKTLESVRIWEEEKENVLALPKNKHWYRTHELAYTILRNFRLDLRIDQARHYFAHVNSAKCCMNNPQRAQANQILFDNCREFIPGELEILDPDIIITQGKWAKLVIDKAFPELDKSEIITDSTPELKIIQLNNHPVIWIETFHPRHTSFHTVNRAHYSQYVEVIKRFYNLEHQIVFEKIEEPQIMKPLEIVSTIKKTIDNNKEKIMSSRLDQKVTGYIPLNEYPETPPFDRPSKADCEGYKFMSVVQLCNLSVSFGKSRGFAHRAFGGDKGDIPVQADRQAWWCYKSGNQTKKYVLIRAVERFFEEEGFNWE